MDKHIKQQFSRPCVADNDHDSRRCDTKEIYFMINLAKFLRASPGHTVGQYSLRDPFRSLEKRRGA